MIGSNDCDLEIHQYKKIQKQARIALEKADNFGTFPTRIDDVYEAAKIVIADEDCLTDSFINKFRKKAGNALKRAIQKVTGLFHASAGVVFLDGTIQGIQRTFLKLHELGHALLPWQRDIYAVVEDCKKTVSPEVSDLFDKEANVFATEVLFQLDHFSKQAEEMTFSIKTPIALSRKYGSSIYSAIRRYVSKSSKACAVIVIHPPEYEFGLGFTAKLRRPIVSEEFQKRFGDIVWPMIYTPDDQIGALIPVGKQRMSGIKEICITDTNGVSHLCLAESFTQGYQVFVLIHEIETLTRSSVVINF